MDMSFNELMYLFIQFNENRFCNTFVKHILEVILSFYVLVYYSY